jgi:hypothetical protein
MLGFLNSAVLVAAAAALIPLLIHLFSRRRVKVVEFSSLRHLKEMQRRQLRRLRIRQWLLLILRMLIILAAVLAFARPTARDGEIGSHATVSAVVLFDNSASMDRAIADGNLFEVARQRTRQLLETFEQADEVALIGLERSAATPPDGLASAAVALAELDRIKRGAGAASLQSALETTVDLLSATHNLNREIYYVGDRQRSTLPETNLLDSLNRPLYLVELPLEEPDNLGVIAVDFGGQLIHPGHDFDLVATVKNYGARAVEERIASLFIDGKRVAQTDLAVPAGGETTVRFTRSVSNTGFHSGYVELSDDRFAGDNRYFFSFRIPDRFNLLIINGDPVANYISLALVPEGSTDQYWSVKNARPNELAGVNFNDYQVVMLAGTPPLGEAQLRRVAAYVRRGGALFVGFGGDTDIDYFNSVWSELTGVIYEQPIRRDFSRAGFYTLQQFDLDHPIFLPFQFDQNDPPQVKFYTIPGLRTVAAANTLLTFTGEQPALVENRHGRGRVLTFTGPMSPQYSDLVTHGFFVPFVSRLAEYLASDLTSLDTRLYAGKSITRALPGSESSVQVLELTMPDSAVALLSPEDEEGSLVVRTGLLSREGVYRLVQSGREIDRFAVNLDPSEGDLTTTDPDQFAVSLGADELRPLGYEQPLASAIADHRVGRELWQLFLWAAAILLAVEMLLGRRAGGE